MSRREFTAIVALVNAHLCLRNALKGHIQGREGREGDRMGKCAYFECWAEWDWGEEKREIGGMGSRLINLELGGLNAQDGN